MYDGAQVRFRALEPGDAERMRTWVNDPEVTAGLAIRYPMSLANEVDWVESNKTLIYGNAVFAVETIADAGTSAASTSAPIPDRKRARANWA